MSGADRLVSIPEAARRYGVSERTIRGRVHAGLLRRESDGKVRLADVDQALRTRGDARGRKLGRLPIRPGRPTVSEQEKRVKLLAAAHSPKKKAPREPKIPLSLVPEFVALMEEMRKWGDRGVAFYDCGLELPDGFTFEVYSEFLSFWKRVGDLWKKI